MKTFSLLSVVACAGFICSCAATVPNELVNARESYRRASTGTTAEVAPAQVHVAHEALNQAERSFQDDPDSHRTRDLAYVAQRKAELAEATASIIIEQKRHAEAKSDYAATQAAIVAKTKGDLSQTREALTEAERAAQATAEKLATEQMARVSAEKRAADAQAALAKLADVKIEPRGMVITLSGSVLFASNQATLLPEAQARLDQVAAVLLSTRERNVTIEGHTDSQGADSHNLELSQRRAEAVRSYLVQKGYQPDLIQAAGFGESRAIADNKSPEGRANNRRVEVVIEGEQRSTTSNP